MGKVVRYSLAVGAALVSFTALSASAAPAVKKFGFTRPYEDAGKKIMLAPDLELGGDVTQVMLRFVNPQQNPGERLLVSNVAPSIRSFVKDNVLVIKGEGSAADYQKVLRTLAYTSDAPAGSFNEQIVEIAVLDGKEASVMSKRIVASGAEIANADSEEPAKVFPLPAGAGSDSASTGAVTQAASGAVAPEVEAPAAQALEKAGASTGQGQAQAAAQAPAQVEQGSSESDAQQGQAAETAVDEAAVPGGGARENGLVSAMVGAYQTNEKLMSKRRELEVTDELASQAFSFWMPQVSLNAQKGRAMTKRPASANIGRTDVNGVVEKYGAEFNMPIFRGGRTMARMSREDQRIFAQRYDLLNTEQETLQQAIESYMAVWRDRNLLDLQSQNENVLKSNLEDTEARFSLGEVTQTDVLQSETRYTRAISERLRAEASLKASEATFKRVIGVNIPVAFRYESPEVFHYFDREELRLDMLQPLAVKYHPLIKTAEFDLNAAVEDVSLKKGELLPTISLNAGINRSDGGNAPGLPDDETSRSVLLNVDVPLYQSGSEYSQVRQAKLTVDKLKYDLEERKQAVTESLETSLKALTASVSAIENNSRQVTAAEKALQSVMYESQLGTRTTLNVLDAQQEFLEAKILLVRSQYDEVVNTYRLLGDMGRLNSVSLRLPVDYYDPEKHYGKVRRKLIGY